MRGILGKRNTPQITVVLSGGRRKIAINEAEWPLIGGIFINPAEIPHPDVAEYGLRVRQHHDRIYNGSWLVYGAYSEGCGHQLVRAGELGGHLQRGAHTRIEDAIKSTGRALTIPDHLIRHCIDTLAPELQ